MPLKLITIQKSPTGVVTSYDLTHCTPGREGTVLKQTIELHVNTGTNETGCMLTIKDCWDDTPDAVMAKMSAWLRRLADGLDDRKLSKTVTLPL